MRSGEKAGCAIISDSFRGNSRRMMLPGERRRYRYFFIFSLSFFIPFTLFA
jgi:hypothetical protein